MEEKRIPFGRGMALAAALFALCAAQAEAQPATAGRDPTVPADAMADALKAQLADAEGMRLHALVVGAEGEGVALVGASAADAVAVRRGSRLSKVIGGVRVEVAIKSVTAAGVELETSAASSRRVFLPGSYTPLAAPTNKPAEFVRYLESEKVPLDRLLRLVADQTGVNISASDASAEKKITVFLRNVTAEAAVEEICRTAGLWFRREARRDVIRVTTMKEYADNLSTFREEETETFTLLYPNVIEVASVIYGLYPDRTLLSLGEEELQEDDEYDLTRRFRRFRVMEENGNAQFMDIQAPRATSSGTRSGSGEFSFSRGSALSRLTQWSQLRRRDRIGGSDGWGGGDTTGVTLPANEAEKLEAAWRTGDTNGYERVYGRNSYAAANIFVSLSRKNNMLVVRTSDVKVMDEIRKLVRKLDVPTPMVLMEVRVLELRLDDNFNATFEYTFNGHSGDLGSAAAKNVLADLAQTAVMDSFTPTFAFKAISDEIVAQIQLLQQDGRIRTLATPTLLTANNEVSRIFDGKEYPLVSGWTVGESTITDGIVDRTEPTVQIEKKDIGNMLIITPNINSDKTVTLRLLQEASEIGGQVSIPVTGGTGEPKDIDYVVSRSLAGTFVAKDGMTVMAGGLISESDEEQYYRTPVLGSLPLVGWLFRGTEKVKLRKEMIILIKPHVIMTPFEGGKISDELMQALSDHPAADGRANMGVFRRGEDPTAKEHTLGDDVRNLVK